MKPVSVLLGLLLAVGSAQAAENAPPLKRLYLVHFSHTDFGFTDLQSVCRELQVRYLDMAVDAVLATAAGPEERKFRWTAESTVAVADWWEQATPQRRQEFLRALETGQLEVAAMPFNQTPFLNARQWRTMLHWLPEDLWQKCKPTIAVQNDVNGLPRAGATALLDRGIKHLFMGINADSGGPPFYRPSAFWWKMPDGRRLFVWLNHSYPAGFDFFETYEWRRGPVPRAGDLQFRPPRGCDVFKTDEASLRAAQAQCLRRIEQLRKEGYPHDVLTISVTSQWRMDNDPPFPHLAEFVAAWNKLGLQPELRFVTASQAVREMEKAIGDKVPEYTGEFTDWWANGTASGPREVAASRFAKRLLAAAESSLWGAMSPTAHAKAESLYKDLCLFDEHTWGSSMSVATPWTLELIRLGLPKYADGVACNLWYGPVEDLWEIEEFMERVRAVWPEAKFYANGVGYVDHRGLHDAYQAGVVAQTMFTLWDIGWDSAPYYLYAFSLTADTKQDFGIMNLPTRDKPGEFSDAWRAYQTIAHTFYDRAQMKPPGFAVSLRQAQVLRAADGTTIRLAPPQPVCKAYVRADGELIVYLAYRNFREPRDGRWDMILPAGPWGCPERISILDYTKRSALAHRCEGDRLVIEDLPVGLEPTIVTLRRTERVE